MPRYQVLPPVYKDAPDPEPEIVVYPTAVRRCATEGCGTILRMSNGGDRCAPCESRLARLAAKASGLPVGRERL